METIVSLIVLTALLVKATSGQICADLDTTGCGLLAAQPGFCANSSLSNSICKRTCGKCPLTCFHCPKQPVLHAQDCNTTQQCATGEMCVLRTLSGNHYEYLMSCDDTKYCNGFGFGFGAGALIGRRYVEPRDINVHCCDGDLCNVPNYVATTTPAPTTLPPIHSCNKDVIFVVDESNTIGPVDFRKVIDLIRAIVTRLDIGVNRDQVALLLYDMTPHIQWYLNDYTTKASLLGALSYVPYHNGSSRTDLALKFVRENVTVYQHGDRPSAGNVAVLFTDGLSVNHQSTVKEATALKQTNTTIITVGVHNLANLQSHSTQELVDIATQNKAVVLKSLGDTRDAIMKIVEMICT
ncbi:collagen alpha-1(XIV) chain-like isoform X3 [Dreissena polymorpha]|uniref:collagen alpha-1(XIV) chain-like isoform X3 n=1 Tax=Dreissena polymorpha TaxID=45954 RepID=UPI0022650263|nr:collagen alpha-1(XIV) chain-like isoform X3 [Dreissena polymorpha]